MPNWCYNNLDITATNDEQKAVLEKVSKAEAQEVWVDGCNNWYDWQVQNWGTKWDPEIFGSCNYDGETLTVSFESAWAPPIAFYEWLVEQGYEVSANYYEPGMDYAGEWVNGDDFMLENISDLARQDTDTLSKREYDILEQWGIWDEVAQWDELDRIYGES